MWRESRICSREKKSSRLLRSFSFTVTDSFFFFSFPWPPGPKQRHYLIVSLTWHIARGSEKERKRERERERVSHTSNDVEMRRQESLFLSYRKERDVGITGPA